MKRSQLTSTILMSMMLLQPLNGKADTGVMSTAAGLEFLKTCNLYLHEGAVLDPNAHNSYMQNMVESMSRQVVGQSDAVEAFAAAVNIFMAGLNDPSRPLGKILFAGPTGVGKTELVRAFIRFLGGDPDKHMVRIDGGEFQEGTVSSSAKGSAPGYVGYKEKDAVLLHPEKLDAARIEITLPDGSKRTIVVLLLDEIEKFHRSFMNLLLGPLDNGRVRLADGTIVNLRDVFIFGTTNLGAKAATALMREKREQIQNIRTPLTPDQADPTGRLNLEVRAQMNKTYTGAIEDHFTPEFINRWDAMIDFHHLTHVEFHHILQKRLAQVQRFIFEGGLTKVGVLVSEDLRAHLVATGTNEDYGARTLERTVNSWIQKATANQITAGEVKNGDVVLFDIDLDTKMLKLRVVASNLSHDQLKQFANTAYPDMGLLNVQFDKSTEVLTSSPASVRKSLIDRLNGDKRLLQEFNLTLSDLGLPGQPLSISRQDSGQKQNTLVTRLIKISGREPKFLLISKYQDNFVQADLVLDLQQDVITRLGGIQKEMTEEELHIWLDSVEKKVKP